MNCQEARRDLSLYIYGELDFASEEKFEAHVEGCASCQRALAREKSWHANVNAERRDVSLDLLAQCRQGLRAALGDERKSRESAPWWLRLRSGFDFSPRRWSWQMALGSFLLFVGFTSARWMDRNGLPGGLGAGNTLRMGMLNPADARVRDIQKGEQGNVRIVVEEVRQGEVTGSLEDKEVRRLLLSATRESADPGIRVYSVEMLNNQSGTDVRDALLYSVLHDPNAAVRLKALESLRRFSADPAARGALKYVLQHDENAGVRSQAIDVLAPRDKRVDLTPELAGTIEDVMRSASNDEYVRARCLQVLQEMNTPDGIY